MIKLDTDERLLEFDFSKITCSKEIGGGTGYLKYCSGKPVHEILADDFNSLVQALGLNDTEDQFFLYMEWDALRTAIFQYLGSDEDIDRERYQLASITHEMDHIEIIQVIRPDRNMPKLVSCFKRSTLPQNQSG
ncbi:MAG: hypothetical protein NPINA01_11820 [Nitrospinaceae bacterium]|nr:MAG: hypothetical protein NPINA01_11820 [Nitrospinaceae bacterium]